MSEVVQSLRVRPLTGRIGAELEGVKLSGDLPSEAVEQIRAALLAHRVVFFRDQHHLDDDEHISFARLIGPLTLAHPTAGSAEGQEHIFSVDASRGVRPNHWHTDVTFADPPPAISVLRALVLPEVGGDTLWANTVAAYEHLPSALKPTIDLLWARHTNIFDYAAQYGDEDPRRGDYQQRFRSKEFTTDHPVVRLHPETKERSILLGGHAQSLRGLSRTESFHLYSIIQEAVTRPENTVRWRWQPGDVAMWDNRSTQHYAINDYGDAPRLMHRVTVAGETPIGIDGRTSVIVTGDASGWMPPE